MSDDRKPPKSAFSQPKINWPRAVLMVLVLLAGIGLIAYMARFARHQGPLICDQVPGGAYSLTGFGHCHQD